MRKRLSKKHYKRIMKLVSEDFMNDPIEFNNNDEISEERKAEVIKRGAEIVRQKRQEAGLSFERSVGDIAEKAAIIFLLGAAAISAI